MKVKESHTFKKGQIRFNFSHGHYGHIKNIENDIVTCVFISTKSTDEQRSNVPMTKNLFNDGKDTYFLLRVRKYHKKTYSTKYLSNVLCFSDRRKSKKIYKYYKNKKTTDTNRW